LLAVPATARHPAALAPPQLGAEVPIRSAEEICPPAARTVGALEVGLAARTRDELPEDDVHADDPDGGTGRIRTGECGICSPVPYQLGDGAVPGGSRRYRGGRLASRSVL